MDHESEILWAFFFKWGGWMLTGVLLFTVAVVRWVVGPDPRGDNHSNGGGGREARIDAEYHKRFGTGE
jgi:hypothetical protein